MSEPSAPPPQRPESAGSYWGGVASAFGLAVAVPTVVSTTTSLPGVLLSALFGWHSPLMYFGSGSSGLAMFFVGVVQWLWLKPAANWAREKGRPEFAKGLTTGGWMIFILNASCWGIVGGFFVFGLNK